MSGATGAMWKWIYEADSGPFHVVIASEGLGVLPRTRHGAPWSSSASGCVMASVLASHPVVFSEAVGIPGTAFAPHHVPLHGWSNLPMLRWKSLHRDEFRIYVGHSQHNGAEK